MPWNLPPTNLETTRYIGMRKHNEMIAMLLRNASDTGIYSPLYISNLRISTTLYKFSYGDLTCLTVLFPTNLAYVFDFLRGVKKAVSVHFIGDFTIPMQNQILGLHSDLIRVSMTSMEIANRGNYPEYGRMPMRYDFVRRDFFEHTINYNFLFYTPLPANYW